MTNQPDDLVVRLGDEADLCRNDGANDIADLLDEAKAALVEADRKNEAMLAEWNAAEARIKELKAEVERSEKHRNDLADKNVDLRVEIGALKRHVEAAEARATKAEALLSEWMDWQAKATADDDCEWLNDEGWPKIEGLARRTREALSEGKA